MENRDTPRGDYSAPALQALADVLHQTQRELRKVQAEGADPAAINALLASARGALVTLCADYVGQSAEAIPIATLGELAAQYWQQVTKRKQAAKTGLSGLDDALGGGFQPGRLMVLLGAPGSGKTTLANQIAEEIANDGQPVVYVTSEDLPEVLLAKTLARLGGLHYSAVLGGYASMRGDINQTLEMISQRQSASRLLYIHDTSQFSLEEIQERAHQHFKRFPESNQGGPGLLVIDYLQRFARSLRVGAWRDLGLDLREAVTLLTERLRSVTLELDCTILALGSQSRASGYGNGDGALMSAKESGDIEYTADVMMILGKAEKETATGHKPVPLQMAKNRQGDTSTLTLDWFGQRQQFTMGGK
jgi:replicative DNA helicase